MLGPGLTCMSAALQELIKLEHNGTVIFCRLSCSCCCCLPCLLFHSRWRLRIGLPTCSSHVMGCHGLVCSVS